MEDESLPIPEITPLETSVKTRKPWYRRVMNCGLGTATLYLKKPVLPPLVEYSSLLVRRNPFEPAVANEDQNPDRLRGAEAFVRDQNRTNSIAPTQEKTGSEVKILRRFRFFDNEESVRPCALDIGLGGKIVLDPSVHMQPVARIRVADCATMMFLPEPIVKFSKKLPFHWQGMQAHLRYEVPVSSLRQSWWKPPARMLVRFEHGSNSGFHLYPGGLEFGDHTIPLTSDSTIALRVAAGLSFPREYPVSPGNGPKWEIYRLGIKTIWFQETKEDQSTAQLFSQPTRCSSDVSTGPVGERLSSSSLDSQRPSSSSLFDSARVSPSNGQDVLTEDRTVNEGRKHSDDSASASLFCINEKEEVNPIENNPLENIQSCQQFVVLYLQLTNKRVEDLTENDYSVIGELIRNPQVLAQAAQTTTRVALSNPYLSNDRQDQALLNAYQNPCREQSSISVESTRVSDPFADLSIEERALLDAYQNPVETQSMAQQSSPSFDSFSTCFREDQQALVAINQNNIPQQSFSKESSNAPDPFGGLTAEEQALLDVYQGTLQEQSVVEQPSEVPDPFTGLSVEEQAMLEAYQNPSRDQSLEQESCQYQNPYAGLSAKEQAMLDDYQNPSRDQSFTRQPSQYSDPFTGLSAEELALLDAYQNPSREQSFERESYQDQKPFSGLTAEEQALLNADQSQFQLQSESQELHQSFSPLANTNTEQPTPLNIYQKPSHSSNPFINLSPDEQALLDAYQNPTQQTTPQGRLNYSTQYPGISAEDQALLDAYQNASSPPIEEQDNLPTEPVVNPVNRISQISDQETNLVSRSSFFTSSSEFTRSLHPDRLSGAKKSTSGRSSEARSSFADEQRVVRPSMDIAGGPYTRFNGVLGTVNSQQGSSMQTTQDYHPIMKHNWSVNKLSDTISETNETTSMARSSFAAERRSIDQFHETLNDLDHLFEDTLGAGRIRIVAENLEMELLERYYQLAVIPPDTVVPLTVLAMLWGTSESVDLEDAEAAAWIMEGKNIIHITIKDDCSICCTIDADHARKLSEIMSDQLVELNSRLINLYRQGFQDLTVVPDDGYFLQNVSLHLAEAGRFNELAELLRDPIWLETKLRSYGTAAVVSDFRRYFSFQEDSDLKLMLLAFQISAKAALDHSTLYVLKEQMLSRLMISADESPGIRDWYNQGRIECKEAVPYRRSKSMPVHLLPRTPSLEQAGGLQRLILKGHTGGIQKVELAPNGLEVVTVSSDGTLRIWDMEIGDFVLHLENQEGSICCFAVAKDGNTLITGGEHGVATIYDLPSGIWRHKLRGHKKRINAVEVDVHCKRVVTSSQDMTTRIWSLSYGTCLRVLTTMAGATWYDWPTHHGVVVSPEAKIVATIDAEFSVRIWTMETGEQINVLEGHSDWVVALAFPGDGTRLLTASHDKTVRLWNLQQGICEHVFQGHRGRINNLVVMSDGSRAVSVSDDSIGIIWDVMSHTKKCELIGHGSWINDAAITPDGSKIITVAGDGIAIVWNGETGKPLRILNGHSSEIKTVCISYKGRFAITGSEDSTARVWDLTAPFTHLADSHQGKVTQVLHHQSSDQVVTIGEDSRVLVWDISSACCIRSITPKETSINFAFLVAEGSLLITASGDRCVCVWDLSTGECIRSLPPHEGSRLKSIAVSPDGKTAIICLFDSTVSVWNLESMELTNWLMKRAERDGIQVHSAAVNQVAITGDGVKAITISKDSTGRMWSLETFSTTLVLRGHLDGVKLLSLKTDGSTCMTAGYDKTARVWDLIQGECLMVLDHPSEIDFLATDPQWRRAVTVAGEKTAWLWDIAKGRCLGILESHGDPLTGVVFSSDGKFLATYSLNSVVRVWTASSGKLRAVYVSDYGISSCEFVGSPQIDTLIVGDGNGHVHFLDFPTNQLSSSRSR
eukprot:g6499.t1